MTPAIAELEFLRAAAELGRRQLELVPLVAEALGRSPYAYWILGDGRDDVALETICQTKDGEWRFNFHGLEFDVSNVADRRGVRVDFGPNGICAFTPGGVGSFVQATRPPWRTFPELKAYLAGRVEYDYARCAQLAEALQQRGLIRSSAPDLFALIEEHTKLVAGRGYVLDIPKEARPADENALVLCGSLVITEQGVAMLEQQAV